jgi:hypothetical protein
MNDDIRHWDGPPLEAWEPWTPEQVARALGGIDVPWCVVGGFAIDLFLGRETRHHEDIEIAIPRPFFGPLRQLLERSFALHIVGDGEVRRLAPDTAYPAERHQCWVLDEAAGKWRLDVMLEPGDALKWVCRRDPHINAPRAWMTATSAGGIPYLVPEAVLLFKAKAARAKDEADLSACLPELTDASRDWLRNALERVHPNHAWLERLG